MNVNEDSGLFQTVIRASMVLFQGGSFDDSEKTRLAQWILRRQNRRHGFIFYPTEQERENGIRLFSGEKARAKFLVDNIVELETLRLLALIQPESPEVQQFLNEANDRLFSLCFANGCVVGECAHASIAFRRYLMAFDIRAAVAKNRQTLEILKHRRNGEGKWSGFPFYFTLLWLTELPKDMSLEELAYARDHCEKLKSNWKNEELKDSIRLKILQRVFSQ